ncbi:hypothetical protein PtA15_12A242 [Puccinia triticina]|uniref:Uncharacterized protein n=1 Tax=Puccinia triticina TaxID=208348 RepID=A0ABY7CY63_9BASI|nr:uncharacterized protein PtA15_12A242 [Puccinia triticina]WAQ90254.1 hypothetical protein PtA15_12A242 [Puccinia triticina]
MHGVSWEDELDPELRRGGSVESHGHETWDRPYSSDDYNHLKGYSDPRMDNTTYREFDGAHHDSYLSPRTPPGVSDADWHEATEELAHLGVGDLRSGSDPIDSYGHHQDPYNSYDGAHHGLSEPSAGLYGQSHLESEDYLADQRDRYEPDFRRAESPAHLHHTDDLSDHHRSLPSPLGFSPARQSSEHYSPAQSDFGRPGFAGSDFNPSRRDFDFDSLNYSNHHNPDDFVADDPLLSHPGADDFNPGIQPSRHEHLLSPSSHDSDRLYQDNTYQPPWSRRASDVRFEDGHRHPPTMTDTDSPDPLASASDYTDFPYDEDHHAHHHPHHHHLHSPKNDYRTHVENGLSNAFGSPELQRAHRLDDYYDPPLADFSQRSPIGNSSFLNGKSRQSPSLSSPLFSAARGADPLDHLNSHSHLHRHPTYSAHQQPHPRDHYQRTEPQGYRGNDSHQPMSYRSDPERSLGHLDTENQRHFSPRDEIERMRAQLDESLARDAAVLTPHRAPERPRSSSWDPTFSESGHRSPHHRAFEPSPIAPINENWSRPTLDRPLSRSGLPYPITSMEETALHTTIERPRSRSGLLYPSASGRRSPYLSGHRSPYSGLSSAEVNMVPVGRESFLDARTSTRTPVMTGVIPAHQHTGSLHYHQDPLRDQLHQINDLNNHIRDAEIAHERERALIDRTAADFARQSLTDELRRSEIAHERDLALADQRASQIGQQSMIQAVRESEIYRDLDHQRHQLDLERAEIARQRDRVDTQTQLGMIDRQLRAIDRQREIDTNRQMANLSRFGNLPSVLRGTYNGRPLASPYLQQSRFLSAARRLSARDKPRHHQSPVVFDHVDAYYRLISNSNLPRQLPLFKDPYYNYDPLSSRDPLRPISSAPLVGRNLGMGNPFVDGIDYDYGYGKVGALGLQPEHFAREQAYVLDDLYLYEMLLRLDDSIDELERQRRWQARLRWEEWADSRSRVQAWSRMSADERRRLGLSDGSFWASNLFGIPLDARFGYQSISNLSGYSPTHLRSHYPLSSRLSSRYPMWSRGGLGLGRRLSNWYDYARRPIKAKYFDRQEQIRREYAQRRGELAPGSRLRPPGSMLSGGYPLGPLTGLGTTRTLAAVPRHLDCRH